MKKLVFILIALMGTNAIAQAQVPDIASKIIGKWKVTCNTTTGFTTNDVANQQVAEKIRQYQKYDDAQFTFKEDFTVQIKFKDGTSQTAKYSASPQRFILDLGEDWEELNTRMLEEENEQIKASFGKGMTYVHFIFKK